MSSSFSPTAGELALVNAIFARADPQKLGIITGDAAVDAFSGSQLSPTLLGEIWGLADRDNKGFLTRKQVAIVVRLMGWAQKGEPLSESLISKPGPLPRLEGIASPVVQQGTGSATPRSPAPKTVNVPPPLTPQDKAKFMKLFVSCGPVNGLLSGDKARDVFMKSKLPVDKLSQIWFLADTQKRGSLDSTDFTIGMYLIQACMSGQLSFVPTSLPPGLYEQAGGGKGPDGGVATHNTGSSGFSSPGVNGGFPGRSPSAIQPQTTGQIQSILQPQHTGQISSSILQPQYTGQPLHPQQTASGLQQRPAPAALGSSAFGLPATSAPAALPWDVTPQEKAAADQFFDTLDTQKKGFIEGDVAVPFFLQSQLPGDVLAQVWDLADMNDDGRLTRDGFAVAMHLIQGKLAGKDIPTTLPPTLIPPSMRGTAAAAPAPAPQVPEAIRDLLWDDTPPPSAQTTSPPLQPQQTGVLSPSARPTSPPQPARAPVDPFGSSSFVAQTSFHQDLLGDDEGDQNKLHEQAAEIGNIKNQLGSTNRSLEAAQKERQHMEQTLANQAAELSSLQTQLSSAKAAYETESRVLQGIKDRFAAQAADIQKAREELIRAESDLSALRVEKAEVEGALLRDKEEVRGLQRRMAEVGTEVEMIKQEIERARKEAKLQKGKLAVAKKQLLTRENEREKIAAEEREAHEEARQAAEELARAQAELAKEPEPVPASVTNGHAVVASPPAVPDTFAPGSPDSLALAAAQPLPLTPDVTGSRVTSPAPSGKSNNPFERLAMGGGSRSQSPFLPFTNADVPTPTAAPAEHSAPAPAAAASSEDPFGFSDAFGTLETSPAETAAQAVAEASKETQPIATLTPQAPPDLAAMSPISTTGTDEFMTPPSTATAPQHSTPFVEESAPKVESAPPTPPGLDTVAPAAQEPEHKEVKEDLESLHEHEAEDTDSSDDEEGPQSMPGALDFNPPTTEAAPSSETPKAPEPVPAANGLSAFDDSFGISTPTTAATTTGFPPASPAPAPKSPEVLGVSAADPFGAPFAPATEVPKADTSAFDEAMGTIATPSKANSDVPAAAPFTFDTAFEDNFDFSTVGAETSFIPSPQPVATATATEPAPSTSTTGGGFDDVFGFKANGTAASPPEAKPQIPEAKPSISFDDAFGVADASTQPSSLSASQTTSTWPSSSHPSAPNGSSNGISFDDAFGGVGGTQALALNNFGTASSKASAASRLQSPGSATSFPRTSPPSSPQRSSTYGSLTGRSASPSSRAVSPPPRHSSPKPRPSTASSGKESSSDHAPKGKEVTPRHSRLSIRLPFGKKKKDKLEQLPPMPGASQSHLAAPIVEEPNSGTATPMADDDVEPVKVLCGMGFSRTQAVEALEKHGYDVPRALNSLLGQ